MINALPTSLVESADAMLRSRLLCQSGEPVLNDLYSIHHEYNGTFVHPVFHQLSEASDSFHDWINETEHTPTKLHMKAYLQQGIDSDNTHMKSRAMTTPMSHPELFHHTFNNMPDDHKNIIKAYSEIGLKHGLYPSGSYRINNFLIDASKQYMKPAPHIRHPPLGEVFNINHMDSALHSHSLPHPLTTYSGIGFNPEHIVNQDWVFNSPAYMSSSTRRFPAAKYAIQAGEHEHHILQINNHVGAHGVYVGNRTSLSRFSDDEYIIPRQTHMKIDPTPTTHEVNGHKFHIWNTHRLDKEYND